MLTADDWTAIGTLALAAVTAGTTITTVVMARKDRKRDDDLRRADQLRDDQKRQEDRDRDDRLRREQLDRIELRALTTRREQEDFEARQVAVTVGGLQVINGRGPNYQITLSTPNALQVGNVEGAWVQPTGSVTAITPFGMTSVQPELVQDRTQYVFR
jgi:hypothetical protein